jgi:hypothetical protein
VTKVDDDIMAPTLLVGISLGDLLGEEDDADRTAT